MPDFKNPYFWLGALIGLILFGPLFLILISCTAPPPAPTDAPDAVAAPLARCPDVGCPNSTTNRRLSPACLAGGCVCGATDTAVACTPTCLQLGCAAAESPCEAPGFPVVCGP